MSETQRQTGELKEEQALALLCVVSLIQLAFGAQTGRKLFEVHAPSERFARLFLQTSF